jgi:hypothetical protein
MSGLREALAERHRTLVGLDLGDLETLLDGLARLADESREAARNLRPLARRIGRARDRRLRAVERAGR